MQAEREESNQVDATKMAQLRRRTRCLVPFLVPLLHLGSVRYHTMTGSRTRNEDDQVLGSSWRTNILQGRLTCSLRERHHESLEAERESPSVAFAWDPGSTPARHAGLHTFSIYLFAYDSLCMMNKLAVAAAEKCCELDFLDSDQAQCVLSCT